MGNNLSDFKQHRIDSLSKLLTPDSGLDRKRTVKILLLGIGDSGKTTILKQMRLLYTKGFPLHERKYFRAVILTNIIASMKHIVNVMIKSGLPFERSSNSILVPFFDTIPSISPDEKCPMLFRTTIKSMWDDANIRKAINIANKCGDLDSAEYFFNNADRIFETGYLPTNEDILRTRIKTIGSYETSFNVGKVTYRVYDVGGQRSERKKWMSCFDDASVLLFSVALSGYDQVLSEDSKMNQIREALTIFSSICASEFCKNASMILLLNKIDLFEEKLLTSPIKEHFPEYTDDNDVASAKVFFKKSFEAVGNNRMM